MPIYRFICENCGKEERLLLKIGQEPPACSECNGKLVKQISRVSFKMDSGTSTPTDYSSGNSSCSGCSGGSCSSCGG
ncbi:FmdB family zinc ribbon protein [Kosmotoga pacifica]|uniref:FmdB family zinc ribbon protein n=1 Tax=Kosmotoga pacifica TaxID=1330330 RepID=UPI0009E4FB81